MRLENLGDIDRIDASDNGKWKCDFKQIALASKIRESSLVSQWI